MPDRRKVGQHIDDHGRLHRPEPAPEPCATEPDDDEPSLADTASRTGRLQIKDGRHNVWETGIDDTQQLLKILHDPALELADEPPEEDGEPGNPYHSTGTWALGKRRPPR